MWNAGSKAVLKGTSRALALAFALGTVGGAAGCSRSQAAQLPPALAQPVAVGGALTLATPPAVGTKAKCAVTGEDFTVDAKTQTSTYNGKVYAFCCPDCKPTFDKNPAKYAK